MTLTTYDEQLCRKLEPNVSTTKERYEALKILHQEGIPTVVWLCTILPFINDTEENLRGILNYCVEAKVYGIINFGMVLTLREGNQYILPSPNENHLLKIFNQTCDKYHIVHDNDKVFEYLRTYEEKGKCEQLSLFDFI